MGWCKIEGSRPVDPTKRPYRLPRRGTSGRAVAFLLLGLGVPGAASSADVPTPSVLLVADRDLGDALAQSVQAFGTQARRVEITPSPIEEACAPAAGPAPRLALLAHAPSRAEIEACGRSAAGEVSTLQIGRQAIALVAPMSSPVWVVDPPALFRALGKNSGAAPLPATWSEVDPGYPRLPIGLLAPPAGSAARHLFDALVLEPGCSDTVGARLPFDAKSRAGFCSALRSDIPVIERKGDAEEVGSWAASAAPGQIAIVTVAELRALDRRVVPLLLDGVLPTAAKVESGEYHATAQVVLLIVVPDGANASARGDARAFAFDLLAEASIGPGGRLAPGGLISLPPPERIAARSQAIAFLEQP